MTLIKRKILFFSFVVAFFLITTVVMFYAQGYRINLTWPPNLNQTLQRNGMLLVETEPKGATILLDGQPPKNLWQNLLNDEKNIQTPAKIKDVKPGEYTLNLILEGYHTWERKINIYPGKITTISSLRLLKKDLPLRVSENRIEKDHLSPDQTMAVDIKNSEIVFLESGQTIPLPELQATSSIDWSPDSRKILADKKILEIDKKRIVLDLEEELDKDAEKLRWDRRGEKIHYIRKGELYSFDPEKQTKQKLLPKKNIFTYFSDDKYLYTIKKADKSSVLEVFSYPDLVKIKAIDFPPSSNYRISSSPRQNLITVYDQKFHTLYLIEPLSPLSVLQETLNNVHYFDWRNPSEVIYGNDFEIWKFNVNTRDKQILTRISEEITEAKVVKITDKILYYDQNNIKLMDLGQNKINVTELIELNDISDLCLVNKGKTLYFNGKTGKRPGLYKLNIY